MPKIILPEFSAKDFTEIVDAFLFLNEKNIAHQGALIMLRGHILRWGDSFQKVFQAYFERTDNVRYDNLTLRMEEFTKKLLEYITHMPGAERENFVLFWNEISDFIKWDYTQLQDQYLKNSCGYFIHQISKLS